MVRTSFFIASSLLFAQTAIRIDTQADRHPISRDIYGINESRDAGGNGADISVIGKYPFTVRRWGGDNTVGYNWKLDADNTAANWYYETFPINKLDHTSSAGSSFDQWVARGQQNNIRSVATVPIIGWTVNSNTAKQCSFSVAKYGPQQQTDVYARDCGNGMSPDGKRPIVNDPTDAYMEVGPEFAQEWVAHVVERYGSAANGGVWLWELDNEPTWWHAVHRHIHPQPATFDEMLDRNIRWARAIKSADPSAMVGGPTPPGWESYFYSASDLYSGWSTGPDYKFWNNPKDCKAHFDDGVCGYFLPWYLRKMREQEDLTGVRLVDYLDLHAYVSPDGLSGSFNAAQEALRLSSTRTFWDPDYMPARDDMRSMDRKYGTGTPQLIRRMKRWIDENYPGTKLAITEYNWGAGDHITGALAQADLLGIFGREGVDLATIWGNPAPEDPAAFAWRMFLDYDGQGAAFGSTSVRATSADPDTATVFAAEDGNGFTTILLLNKTASDQPVALDAPGLENRAVQAWRYSDGDLKRIKRLDDAETGDAGHLDLTLPRYSMTMLVVLLPSQ